MTLTKLGSYIEQLDNRNINNALDENLVVGLSTQKEIIQTKADLSGVNLAAYKLFTPKTFAYVPDTSRRGNKVSLAYNTSDDTYIVSTISIVFKVKRDDLLLSDYLFMYFNRHEFDRYARFNSWGSAREIFPWEEMCDIDIELPPIDIQQKYVNIYNSMLANQRNYERGLDDLKTVFEGYMNNLRNQCKLEPLRNYMELVETKNEALQYGIDSVKGVSIEKKFIDTKANMIGVNL